MNDYKKLIKQLQELANNPKIYLSLSAAFSAAADAIKQLVKERDVAISDLRRINPCVVCKHFSEGNCGCDAFYECAFEEGDLWEWRGLQHETN